MGTHGRRPSPVGTRLLILSWAAFATLGWAVGFTGRVAAVTYDCTLTANCETITIRPIDNGSGTATSSYTKTESGGQARIDCQYANGVESGTCSLIFRWLHGATPAPADITFTPDAGSCALLDAFDTCTGLPREEILTLSAGASVNADVDYQIEQRSIDVTSTGAGAGTVTLTYDGGATLPCDFPSAKCEITTTFGDVVTLDAVASDGSKFGGWSGGPCTGKPAHCSVTLDSTYPTVSVSTNVVFGIATPTAPPTHAPTKAPSTPTPTSAPSRTSAPGNSPSTSTGPAPSSAEATQGSSTGLPGVSALVGTPPSGGAATPPSSVSSAASSGDSTPWLAIIAIVALIVIGGNVMVFQVVRARRRDR